MPRPNAPCKDCSDRYLGCHDKCEKYQKFHKECFEYNMKFAESQGYLIYADQHKKKEGE